MNDSEARLDVAMSGILLVGVVTSLIIVLIGIFLYHVQYNSFSFNYTPEWQLTGSDFFGYSASLFSSISSGVRPTEMMALGIVILMLTSYARVAVSVVYYGLRKNPRYLLITAFVMVILTASLLVHR